MVEIVEEHGFEQHFVQNKPKLVCHFMDLTSQHYKIGSFEQELETLKEIQKNQVKDLPMLMDWGTFQDKFKFIITNAHGENLETVFRDSLRSFKVIDVLKLGI